MNISALNLDCSLGYGSRVLLALVVLFLFFFFDGSSTSKGLDGWGLGRTEPILPPLCPYPISHMYRQHRMASLNACSQHLLRFSTSSPQSPASSLCFCLYTTGGHLSFFFKHKPMKNKQFISDNVHLCISRTHCPNFAY